MSMKKKLLTLFSATALTLGLAACGDSDSSSGDKDYPTSNLTIVAPSGAGGGWDLTARSIAKVMNETKLIENRLQ